LNFLDQWCIQHLQRQGYTVMPPGQPVRAVIAPEPLASKTGFDSVEQEFLAILNRYRKANQVSSLAHNAALQLAAEKHSAQMLSRGHVGHQLPTEKAPHKRAEDQGYQMAAFGENTARVTSGSAQAVFEAWRNSPPHNAIMLDPVYRDAGVAAVRGGGSWWWTLDVGKQK